MVVVQVISGFPSGPVIKNPSVSAGDAGSIPGLGRSPGERMATHSSILPWKSHGQRSLAGFSPWGCREVDMTEHTLAHALGDKVVIQ